VSVNVCTARLLIARRLYVLGLCDWGHAVKYCVLCAGIPHCQHSAAPLFLRCIVIWLSLYTIFLLLRHNYGKASRRVERIETYTIGVQCEALTVENVNGKKHVDIFRLMILKSVYNKYGVCILLRCLGIRYNSSLFYTIQICKLRQNWQCQEWLF